MEEQLRKTLQTLRFKTQGSVDINVGPDRLEDPKPL